MSLILNNNELMTLVEANKREGYDRNEGFMLDLAKQHHILDVMPFYPSSDGSFHKYTKGILEGEGTWRDLNEGRKATRGSMESITTPVKIFSTETNISDDVLRTAKNAQDVRSSEDLLVGNGLVNSWLKSLIYSDGSNEKEMKGFVWHRPTLGKYCLDAGGTNNGGLTSIYVAKMGTDGVNTRYNPQLTGDALGIGLRIEDQGALWKNDHNGRDMKIWKTTYDLTSGLEVRLDDNFIRIANVDIESTIQLKTLIKAIMMLRSRDNAVIIAPRCVEEMLINLALTVGQYQVNYKDIEGIGPITAVMGVPVIVEEAILTNENKVTA